MNIPEGRLIKHQQKNRCKMNMNIKWERREVVIASRCAEVLFSLIG